MKLTEIKVDSALQARCKLNEDVINEYAEVLREGGTMPPVTVFHDGASYFLVDGWHRFFAHKKAGLAAFQDVTVIEGTKREAILYAVGANNGHGLRRTNDDKRKAVMMLLDDVEWNYWNDSEVARAAHVSHMTVSRIRESLGIKKDVVKTNRNGKEVTLNTANIGNKNESFEGNQESNHIEITSEMEAIVEENEALLQRLAIHSMEATDEEKGMAKTQLEEMSATIKTLQATNDALTTRLNTEINKVSDMTDQVKYWKRRAEKSEKATKEMENQLAGLKNLAGL